MPLPLTVQGWFPQPSHFTPRISKLSSLASQRHPPPRLYSARSAREKASLKPRLFEFWRSEKLQRRERGQRGKVQKTRQIKAQGFEDGNVANAAVISKELQEIQKVLSEKDHYKVLGLERNVSKENIKAAYKKLAFKFHPDKNKTPKAIDAFRKIVNSYQILTNQQKRARYDQFGDQEPRRPQAQRHYEYFYQQQMNPFMFFNMGQFRRGRRQPEQHESQPYSWINILFFAFIFIMMWLPNIFQQTPRVSLYPSSSYPVSLKSQKLSVNYFTTQHEYQQLHSRHQLRQQLDQLAELKYLRHLQKECSNKRHQYEVLMYNARNQMFQSRRNYYVNLANSVNMQSCYTLQQLQQSHRNYINYLDRL